jgi:hypothetical protein
MKCIRLMARMARVHPGRDAATVLAGHGSVACVVKWMLAATLLCHMHACVNVRTGDVMAARDASRSPNERGIIGHFPAPSQGGAVHDVHCPHGTREMGPVPWIGGKFSGKGVEPVRRQLLEFLQLDGSPAIGVTLMLKANVLEPMAEHMMAAFVEIPEEAARV